MMIYGSETSPSLCGCSGSQPAPCLSDLSFLSSLVISSISISSLLSPCLADAMPGQWLVPCAATPPWKASAFYKSLSRTFEWVGAQDCVMSQGGVSRWAAETFKTVTKRSNFQTCACLFQKLSICVLVQNIEQFIVQKPFQSGSCYKRFHNTNCRLQRTW